MPVVRIVLNCQNSSLRDFGGAGRYVGELVRQSRLSSNSDFKLDYINLKEQERWDDKLSNFQKSLKIWASKVILFGDLLEYLYGLIIYNVFFISARFKRASKFLRASKKESLGINPAELAHSSDSTVYIYHEPVNYTSAPDIGTRLARKGFAFCSTFLDIQDLYYPENFSFKTLSERCLNYSMYARNCDFFFSISEFTKRCMIEKLGIPENKIHVTYLGSDISNDKISEEDLKWANSFGRYWIYPSKFWPHKNHFRLLQSISKIRDIFIRENIQLILTGGFSADDFSALEREISRLGLWKSVRVLGFVSEERVQALIKSAELLVFPSLFEGFGMPIVEAMRLGCPVACSIGSSLSEISKGAALEFDPTNQDSIISILESVLNNKYNKSELVLNGQRVAMDFTWEKCFEKTSEIYRRYI